MVDVRAYMMQRAKVPAKVHALDSFDEAPCNSSQKTRASPRLVLPRVKGAQCRSHNGDDSSVVAVLTSSRKNRDDPKPRPYSEPVLDRNPHKSTSSRNVPKCASGPEKSASRNACSSTTGAENSNTAERRKASKGSKARSSGVGTSGPRKETPTVDTDLAAKGAPVAHARTPSYGKVPSYIRKMKQDKARDKALAEAEKDKIVAPPGYRQVSDEERTASLAFLRKQKADLDEETQRAPFRVETLAQQNRERKRNDDIKRVDEGLRLFSKSIVFVPENCQPLTAMTGSSAGNSCPDADSRQPSRQSNKQSSERTPSSEKRGRRSSKPRKEVDEPSSEEQKKRGRRSSKPRTTVEADSPPQHGEHKKRTSCPVHDDPSPCGDHVSKPCGIHGNVSGPPSPNRKRATGTQRDTKVKRFEWEQHIDEEDAGANSPASLVEVQKKASPAKAKNDVRENVGNSDRETVVNPKHGHDSSEAQETRRAMGMEGRKVAQPPGGQSSVMFNWG